jgi:hypothetical protein
LSGPVAAEAALKEIRVYCWYCLARAANFHEQAMGKMYWKIAASVGFLVFCLTAAAALESRDAGSITVLAQSGERAVSATTLPPDPKRLDQSPPALSLPPNPTSTTQVVKPAPTVPGCALKYMAAEVAGKLKGRKWKEFRQEECEAVTTQAVFPSMIAPKYSGESPDKARTLTCADQFNANKTANANGGMRWIEKGGGYYSECVSRLKG